LSIVENLRAGVIERNGGRRCLEHKNWSKEVKKRDGWKCKIADKNCAVRKEAHHIRSYKEYPEERYDIKNGITLCHFHHPKKRSEEKHLEKFFKKLIQ